MPSNTTFTRIVYFGDSVTDTGNLSGWVSTPETGVLPPPPYVDGAFSNGELYSQIAPRLMGVSDVMNYAVAGARAIGSYTLAEILDGYGYDTPPGVGGIDINLGAQVDRFLADSPVNGSDTAASLLIGFNDFGAFDPSSTFNPFLTYAELVDLIDDTVAAIKSAAIDLARSGVGTIIVNTVPDADFFPAISGMNLFEREAAQLAAELFNGTVKDVLGSAKALKSVNVQFVELGLITDEIQADRSTFGFIRPLSDYRVETGSQTDLGNPGGVDDDQFAFFDSVHPTTAVHGIIAAFTERSLNGNIITGGSGDNDLEGGGADDFVLARFGGDFIRTYRGDDVAFGGRGGDDVRGGSGNDILSGGSGDDDLYGGSGNDILAGGRQDDLIKGQAGRDLIIDGLGSDRAHGGGWNDIFLYTEAALIGGGSGGTDYFNGNSGNGDAIYLALTAATRAAVETLSASIGMEKALEQTLDMTLRKIEKFVLVDDRQALAQVAIDAGYEDADLWGFV